MDLVEYETFYIALFCEKTDVRFQSGLLLARPNLLTTLLPDAAKYENTVHVCELTERKLLLAADIVAQRAVCYFV
jgi:hypothetical protein